MNERHYGALQGMDKKDTVAQYGKDQVQLWRRSYDVPPPPVEEEEPASDASRAATVATCAVKHKVHMGKQLENKKINSPLLHFLI